MAQEFFTPGNFPFVVAMGLFLGLLILELTTALLGGTLLGLGGTDLDGPDLDGPDLEMPAVALSELADLDVDLDGLDLADGDLTFDMPEELAALEPASGPLTWLGFGRMPVMIWVALVLISFGLGGITLQMLATKVLGGPLPYLIAVPLVGLGAIAIAARFGAWFARLIPKEQTEAVSERHLGRRTGVVSQGTAARGRPAEVRVTDRFGNLHYLRAEPLSEKEIIHQGTEVLVLRHRREAGYRLVALGGAAD